MLHGSITVSLLKKLWDEVHNSALYALLSAVVSYIAECYNCSCLKKVLLKVGDVSKYTETSVFYRLMQAVFGTLLGIAVRIAAFIKKLGNGSIVSRVYERIFSSSVIFGTESFFAFVAAAIFLVPHDYWNNIFGLAAALLLAVLYVFYISSRPHESVTTEIKKIPFSFFIFIFSVLLAVISSHDIADSVRVLFFFITSFLLCFAVYGRLDKLSSFECFMRTAYFTLLVMSLFAVIQRVIGVEADASLTDLSLNKDMPGRVFGTMDNPNNLAEYLMIFIPFGFAYAVNEKKRTTRMLYLAFMALSLVAILLTYSRSGWIALAVAVIVYIALYNYRAFPGFIICGLFALPFIPQSIYDRILTIGNLKDSSSSYRMDIWTGCLEMLQKYWFTGLGLGPGAFAMIYPDYAVGEASVVMHSHMQFMEMMVEGGILCFVAYVALVFGLLRRACIASARAKNSTSANYAIAAAASLSGITLIGLFEYCWFYPRVMFAFFISAGLCLAISKIIADENGENA